MKFFHLLVTRACFGRYSIVKADSLFFRAAKKMKRKKERKPIYDEFIGDLKTNLKKFETRFQISSAEMLRQTDAETPKSGGKHPENDWHKWRIYYRAYLKMKKENPEI